ncbi:MAG TPA: DinB family protein, partial [Bryobacteraceae bacterium]|nr:DinB family protein [Bryobacteraceae bacterium]
MTFSQTLLPEFDAEMKKTRTILERVPDDKFDYKPHEKSMNLGRLATHIAEVPNWAMITIDQDVLDMQPGYKPHIATSQGEVLEIFDKNVGAAREKIAGATDEHWNQIWTFKFNGKTMME